MSNTEAKIAGTIAAEFDEYGRMVSLTIQGVNSFQAFGVSAMVHLHAERMMMIETSEALKSPAQKAGLVVPN